MPARSPRSRAALLAAGFVAVAAIGIGIGYAVRGSGSGSSGRASSSSSSASASPSSASSSSAGAPASTIVPPTTVATAGLQGDAAELAAAINKAAGLTYDAVYKGTTTGSSGASSEQTVEIWLQRPLARRDTMVVSTNGSLHTEEFRLSDRIIGCIDTALSGGPSKFTCVPTEGRGVDPADPLIGVARPTSGTVTARNDTVGSVAARCFTVKTTSATEEACFDGDGIPVSIDGGDGRLVRQQVGTSVDSNTFVPPASTQSTGTSSSSSPVP